MGQQPGKRLDCIHDYLLPDQGPYAIAVKRKNDRRNRREKYPGQIDYSDGLKLVVPLQPRHRNQKRAMQKQYDRQGPNQVCSDRFLEKGSDQGRGEIGQQCKGNPESQIDPECT